jgi:hypothetical protein
MASHCGEERPAKIARAAVRMASGSSPEASCRRRRFDATPATQTELPYDPEKNLVPVMLMTVGDLFVITGRRAPLDYLADVQKQVDAQVLVSVAPGRGQRRSLGAAAVNDEMGLRRAARPSSPRPWRLRRHGRRHAAGRVR